MRLGRLDLLRYGHFTDRSFDLPVGEIDFHILFGPNEAGKSTALAAIEDLLFGIPARTPYGYSHGYSGMRIGALLQNGENSLEVVRRKGSKNTLLDSSNSTFPLGEASLRRLLGGADRSFFMRLFSLDHARLEEGGRELLRAEDEVGQMLFAAGAGIAGLRDRLAQLLGEADGLWAARRAKHRKFYRVTDKLQEARMQLQRHTVSADDWSRLKRNSDAAEQEYERTSDQFQDAWAESTRLARIRRVYPDIRRKAALEQHIEDLGSVATLPENAQQMLGESELEETRISAQIDLQRGLSAEACKELKTLIYDEQFILRGDVVKHLHERRIEVRKEKVDLLNRQVELHAAEAELRVLAAEMGWRNPEIDDLIARIPARVTVNTVRLVLNHRGGLVSDLKNKRKALEEAKAECADLRGRLEDMGEMIDVSRLASVIKTVRARGDSSDRASRAVQDVENSQACIDRLLASLNPRTRCELDVVEIEVPAQISAQAHSQKLKDWEERSADVARALSREEQELEQACEDFQSASHEEEAVTLEVLHGARSDRDALWSLVKRKHIEKLPISDDELPDRVDAPEDLADAFESEVLAADELADRRFDLAGAVGRLEEISRRIGEHRLKLARLQKRREILTKEGRRLDTAWRSLWAVSQLEPLAPDTMLQWLATRDELLKAIERRAKANSALEFERRWERSDREQLLAELSSLGVDSGELDNDSLSLTVEHADGVRVERELQAASRIQLEENLRKAETTVKLRSRDLGEAKQAWSQWEREWSASLSELGLATDSNRHEVSGQIELIDEMRNKASKIHNLRHERIDKINRDIADFESDVSKAVSELADDLAGTSAEDAVSEIEKRQAKAKYTYDLKVRKTTEIEKIKQKMRSLEEERAKVRASRYHLNEIAGVDSTDELRSAIEASDSHRTLKGELDSVLQRVREGGDGLALAELEAECDAVDIDRIPASEEALTAEVNALRDRLSDASETRSQARVAFGAVGGDDAAATAEARRQEALAELRSVAENYVRSRTSALLLQWAIDRYRKEKQAPLLKRAGELFAMITQGAFEDLEVDYDRDDRAYVIGLRSGGESVRVSGMSKGTVDQLYLALRIAFVEDYLERADALPFVADDLFINFDNLRAGAGFRVLGELAKKTQVLFLTHHSHLSDIAQNTLGDATSVVNLGERHAGGTT